MDYKEKLVRLAINDESFAEAADDNLELDIKTHALVRIASLIAVGAATPSYGAEVDGAVESGATVEEIVDVLLAVIPIVGLPCVVEAAPNLAIALGYDTEQNL